MKTPQVFGLLVFLFLQQPSGFASVSIRSVESAVEQVCKNIEIKSPTLRLKRSLFCDYDPSVRPVTSHQIATNVTVKLIPKMLSFIARDSKMELHAWMVLAWMDSHLTWNPTNYEGIDFLHIRSDDIWMPDISLYNSGDMTLSQNGVPSTSCYLKNTGSIRCIPALSYTSRCVTDFSRWPYDKHECRIKFGSWSHTGEEISIDLDDKGYDMDSYVNNTEWNLAITNASKIVKKFKCCPRDTFPLLEYAFTLQRHHGIFHATFVTPALALMLLTLTVLWLDSRSTERIAVAGVNFICHLLCITDLHWQLPSNGNNPPRILLFYRDSLALAAFALVLTALLRKLQVMSIEAPSWVSSTISIALNNKAGRFLILQDDDSKISTVEVLANESEENADPPKTKLRPKESSWRQFAAIIEWLSLFCVFLTYVIILAVLVPVG